MRKRLPLLLVAGMLAFAAPAQAHPNYHYEGGCEVTTVSDGGASTTREAVASVLVVATDAGGFLAFVPISVTCELYVNGWYQGTILAASGTGFAANAAPVTYEASGSDVVTVCEDVNVNGNQHYVCRDVEQTPLVPEPIRELISNLTKACADGLDNDADGYADWSDPGCDSPGDTDERGWIQCDDGMDNDGDRLADRPLDPGCADPWDNDESNGSPTLLGCDDGLDNDGDGYTDMNDPGCSGPTDGDERGTYVCDDGVDNDGDGTADYPADDDCTGPTDGDERGPGACADGVDNDLDGRTDYPSDPGCSSYSDDSERGGPCDDGADNDGDGLADASDPGCSDAADTSERGSLPCDDGIDNDGDSLADHPSDPGCRTAADPNETTIP